MPQRRSSLPVLQKDKLAPGLKCSVLIGANDEKDFCPVCCRKLPLAAEPQFVTLDIDGNREGFQARRKF